RRKRMSRVYAPDGTGLVSEDLGQDAVLGWRCSSVEQRSRLGWQRRITIGVCGKSKCIAKFAESAQHVSRTCRKMPASGQRGVYEQYLAPAPGEPIES